MATLIIQHRVADYGAWKRAFDADPIGRAKNGVTRHVVFRHADDPNSIVVSLEFASRERAQQFLSLLQTLWQRVGNQIGLDAAGGVQARVLEEAERVDY